MSRPTHQQEDAQKRDSLRDDSECELEHDEDRFGDSSLHGPGQHVLVFGYGVEVVCGSVPQPEFLRSTNNAIHLVATETTAAVAMGDRVPKYQPTDGD